MRIKFILKQTLMNLWTAKTPTFGAIISISISLAILLGMAELGVKTARSFDFFKNKFQMDVFLLPTVTQQQILDIQDELASIHQIRLIHFVSKKDAAKKFQREFGEDIYEILDDNPLPPSFEIKFYRKMTHPVIIENVAKRIKELDGVDDVKYHREVLLMIEKYFRIIMLTGGMIAFIMIVAMNILIRNTIRLSVYSRVPQIRILKLMGAANFFIRVPYLLEGFIEGLLGGASGAFILYVLFKGISYSSYMFFNVRYQASPAVLWAAVILGILMGVSSSGNAVRRFLKTIK